MSQNENNGVLQSVLNYLIPRKSDDRNEKFRKIVFLFSIAVFIASLVQLGLFLRQKGIEEATAAKMQEYAPHLADEPLQTTQASPKTPDTTKKTEPAVPQKKEQRTVQPWGQKLLDKNPDVVGWLDIPTHTDSSGKKYINTVVVKGKNNDEYLYRDLDRKYSLSGTPFADSSCRIDKDGQSDNITIYAHHMNNLGTGFARIHEYKESVDFLKKNPVINFNTVYDKSNQKYVVIGCFITNAYTGADDGKIFKYWKVKDFSDKNTPFDEWISEVNKRSWYSSNVKCTAKDKYITLSTCSDECWGIRWVIVAKKLTENDDLESIVQSYTARPDSEIYFPSQWVRKRGNKKVYFGWAY